MPSAVLHSQEMLAHPQVTELPHPKPLSMLVRQHRPNNRSQTAPSSDVYSTESACRSRRKSPASESVLPGKNLPSESAVPTPQTFETFALAAPWQQVLFALLVFSLAWVWGATVQNVERTYADQQSVVYDHRFRSQSDTLHSCCRDRLEANFSTVSSRPDVPNVYARS
jgi:hypothetical protein